MVKDYEDEEELDEALAAIYDAIMEDEQKPGVLNILKYQQIKFAYTALQHLLRTQDVKITYKLNKPFRSMGSVSIEGKSISMRDAEWFSRVAEFASNMEVYPLTNGKIRMTFTFHGLVDIIDDSSEVSYEI